jgi:hypothetical protein
MECQNYGTVQFLPGFNVDELEYINYEGDLTDGVTRVITYNPSGNTTYTILGDPTDSGFGTINQRSGVFMTDRFDSQGDLIISEFIVKNEGFNETNTSLSAITKLEEYLGVVFPSEIQSDVFIDRGYNVIFEPHFKLGEVESVEHLERFGNGYYNIIK